MPTTVTTRRRRAPRGLPACRLGRGELTVHEPRHREELPAIEAPRQRVAAVVVDPVEDRDAILDRVPEGRVGLVVGGLAHLQRETLMLGVLVHEEGRRLLVARHETATDEGVAELVQ